MGPDQSIEEADAPQFVHPFKQDVYVSMSGARSSMDRNNVFGIEAQGCSRANRTNRIIKSAFNGIWSVYNPRKLGPGSRTGHFTVNDPENRCVYIGDGMLESGNNVVDLWRLDMDTLEWNSVPLSGTRLKPKTGEKAVLYRGLIVVFGGFDQEDYITELHIINPQTGEVKLLDASGELPAARSSPIMEVVNDKMYLWGGFNGTWLADLSVLDFKTMTWSLYPQNVSGRTNVPSVVYKNHIYSYGGSKTGGLLDIDTTTNTVSVVQTTGQSPPKAMGSGMVLVGDHIVFYGGKTTYQGSLVYACNLKKKWWFVFHVLPDGETVSTEDGLISDIGLFMIPKFSSFSAVYDEKNRTILSFLGEPHEIVPVINKLDIAEALAHLNLREDLLFALRQ